MTDFRIAEIHYYMGNLEISELIFNQMESPLYIKEGAQYYLGMIASQKKDSKKVQHIISQLRNFPEVLLDDNLRISSMHFGIGNEEKGFKYLDDFFGEPSTQKLKFNYKKYIFLDKNFGKYNSIIGRNYFEQKNEN